jgi:hypothetical protein
LAIILIWLRPYDDDDDDKDGDGNNNIQGRNRMYVCTRRRRVVDLEEPKMEV